MIKMIDVIFDWENKTSVIVVEEAKTEDRWLYISLFMAILSPIYGPETAPRSIFNAGLQCTDN